MNQRLTKICKNFIGELDEAIGNQPSADIFVLTDTNTEKLCLPALKQSEKLKNCHTIVIAAGDDNKNIESAVQIWKYLSENGATRK